MKGWLDPVDPGGLESLAEVESSYPKERGLAKGRT